MAEPTTALTPGEGAEAETEEHPLEYTTESAPESGARHTAGSRS